MSTVRKDFPIFNQNDGLVFFDSAASAQKPKQMIDALNHFYSHGYANIHRGIYGLSARATEDFEETRKSVAKFINADSAKTIIFTKNATEAINLAAHSFGNEFIDENDEILISAMEHHANIVPWQQVCQKKKAVLKIIPITKDGEVLFNALDDLLSSKTKLIAITQMSNVLGSVVDIKKIVQLAKKVGARVLVDACQSIAHMKVDVADLDCDFLVFSAHKLYGPNGVGILYGKSDLLKKIPPYQTGGSMIKHVAFERSTFLEPPNKFEAGTPAIAEVIAFKAVLDYLESIDLTALWNEEVTLAQYIRTKIAELGNYKILGNCDQSTIISVVHLSAHHSDIGDVLDQCGVAIRTGHHCAEPLMTFLGVSGTARISLGIYNNMDDADRLIMGLKTVDKMFT
ncbi:aminotransferase class V-fold PLP-dependent enzyme [Candidatus Bandiella euplotis]|uniref:Cysteine desulfurase n=1 Tax=Candidatus Bandiella euplotis TaxID=1664265 RepID=A0ABZ0ULT2_9RICK|nr:SufS family cysteine desulfurase [Candidatus Bandiella woodruffii]WPX96667.1 SufS family cysteine desulfurase [Candidatus Bandiella woodruffii]